MTNAEQATTADDEQEVTPVVLPMAPSISTIEVGNLLPTRQHTPTNVSLFLYNAAVWNPHRIHYDEGYAIGAEGHPGIVIDGPLQGDWISQVVLNWLNDADELVRFSYSNRSAAYLGETLTSGGSVVAIDIAASLVQLDLFVANEAGEVITPGTATVFLSN